LQQVMVGSADIDDISTCRGQPVLTRQLTASSIPPPNWCIGKCHVAAGRTI